MLKVALNTLISHISFEKKNTLHLRVQEYTFLYFKNVKFGIYIYEKKKILGNVCILIPTSHL